MKKISLEDAQNEMVPFLESIQSMLLSTVDTNAEPFVSYSPYVQDDEGNFYVFISTAVKHSHNINATGKAHIMFLEDESKTDHIYARRRMYFTADAQAVQEDEKVEAIHTLFKKRFGEKVSFFSMMKDSKFYQFIPRDGNFVLGFGAAFKIAPDRKTLTLNDKGHSTSHSEGLKKGF